MSKLPIFELFISVGNLKPKLKWIFKLKLEQKNSIELSPGQTWSHSLHLAVEDGATLKVSEAVYDRILILPNNFCHYSAETISA